MTLLGSPRGLLVQVSAKLLGAFHVTLNALDDEPLLSLVLLVLQTDGEPAYGVAVEGQGLVVVAVMSTVMARGKAKEIFTQLSVAGDDFMASRMMCFARSFRGYLPRHHYLSKPLRSETLQNVSNHRDTLPVS